MTQLNQYVEKLIDGKAVKIPLPQPPQHVNPPLHTLNVADREAVAGQRKEIDAVVKAGIGAMRHTAANNRRMQKPLRAAK